MPVGSSIAYGNTDHTNPSELANVMTDPGSRVNRRRVLCSFIVGAVLPSASCAPEGKAERTVSRATRLREINMRRQLVAKLKRGWPGMSARIANKGQVK
jgi:hypothetical protein